MQKDVLLTPEGLDKLKAEIEHLSTDKRREVAERIKEARDFGDISENSEYDDAKNEQAMLEARIATLEDKLRSAAVMLARGSLGNPWLFAQLLDDEQGDPTREEILDELDWIVERAVEHLGEERAARYLRKFYPWYLTRLGAPRATLAELQCANTLEEQREILRILRYHAPPLVSRAA